MAQTSAWFGVLVGLALSGCSFGHYDEGPTTDDAAPKDSPDTPSAPWIPKVGSTVDGLEVVSVTPYSTNCAAVTVRMKPAWSCSKAQLAGLQGTAATAANPASGAPLGDEGVRLRPTDCEGLATLRRDQLKRTYQSTLDSQRRAVLASQCIGALEMRWYTDAGRTSVSCIPESPLGGPPGGIYTGAGAPGAAQSVPAPPSTAPTTAPNATGGAKEYSTTNTQVVGVDEADFVKNDAEHVYILTARGLHVIDAWPAAETHEVALVSVPGVPRRMFLDGDRLVVYTGLPAATENPFGGVTFAGGAPTSAQGCTYGYGCRFASEGGSTLVSVFDVSEPATPKELRRYRFSGGFVAARRVGSSVYTVVHDQAGAATPAAPVTLALSSANAADAASFEVAYEERRLALARAVDEQPRDAFLPWFAEQSPGAGERGVPACDSAYASAKATGQSFVSLVAFDLDTLAEPSRTLLATKPGFVYSSATALYLAVDGVDGADGGFYAGTGSDERSTIHKLSLDGTHTRYAGSQAVRGHVLNQFSMDEHASVLRVATSSGMVPMPGVSSNVTTLAGVDGQLVRQGELTGLAPNEDIRAVRFDGDRGFVVTFKKTDPLFAIDLANAKSPRVLGELKIPGFSTYMHPIDANHLLSVGFDADDQGDFAYFDGIQIQLFDVTELTNPTLMYKHVIGTRGSGSEALMNHLAFNYFPQKGLLALPMTICEGGGDGAYGRDLTFSGLMVFDVSLDRGISEHGRMPFVDLASIAPTNAATCGAWWTNSTSLVKRSIFMDDFAFGISDARLRVAPLSELSNVVQSLSL